MAEGGLPAATIDAIRDRSGVSKTTIYKHWPSRLCVAVDAFAERLASDASLPDTGRAQGDFREQISRVSEFYASRWAASSPSCWSTPGRIRWPRSGSRPGSLTVASAASGNRGTGLSRAARSGKDIDPDLAMDLVFGPVMWRVASGRRPLTSDEADALVNSVLNGLRATSIGSPGMTTASLGI